MTLTFWWHLQCYQYPSILVLNFHIYIYILMTFEVIFVSISLVYVLRVHQRIYICSLSLRRINWPCLHYPIVDTNNIYFQQPIRLMPDLDLLDLVMFDLHLCFRRLTSMASFWAARPSPLGPQSSLYMPCCERPSPLSYNQRSEKAGDYILVTSI